MPIKNLTRNTNYSIPNPISNDNLCVFEKSLGDDVSLPKIFRQFILKYNGGVFKENILFQSPIGPVVASTFYSLDSGDDSISEVIGYFHDEVSSDVIPFCDDPGGNCFLLGYKKENWDKVYFWNHETQEVILLVDSFESFINLLEVDR